MYNFLILHFVFTRIFLDFLKVFQTLEKYFRMPKHLFPTLPSSQNIRIDKFTKTSIAHLGKQRPQSYLAGACLNASGFVYRKILSNAWKFS